MANHYNLWLEYPGDRRLLRDFLFDACKCTHFWTGPMSTQEGKPDNREREYYAVNSDYHLIDLSSNLESSSYKNDLHVFFTLNQHDRGDEWERDVIDASIRWLARSAGDALLDWDGLPILGRNGTGPVVVNDFSNNKPSRRVELAGRPQYQELIVSALRREGLTYQVGPLKPL